MRSAPRGAVSIRAAGAAASIAGLALLSFGTVTASADTTPGLTSTASADRDGTSATLTDKIVLVLASDSVLPQGGVGTPKVSLFTGDCATPQDEDELTGDAAKGDDVLVKDNIVSEVVKTDGKMIFTATTDAAKVKVDEGDTDFHFMVSWHSGDAPVCEDVRVPRLPESTPTPTAKATATPLATAKATPTPLATAKATATPLPVVTTTSTTSAVSAVSAVKTPSTGADLPFAAGGLLTLSGLGLLLGGARRRRNSR